VLSRQSCDFMSLELSSGLKARHSKDCSRRLHGMIGCRRLWSRSGAHRERQIQGRRGEPDECTQVRGMVMQGGPTWAGMQADTIRLHVK
jgi:hypothetical protein